MIKGNQIKDWRNSEVGPITGHNAGDMYLADNSPIINLNKIYFHHRVRF